MASLDVTFDIPAKILSGLADGSFTRNGGVIQNSAGQVVMWLKEAGNIASASGVSPQTAASQMLSGVDATGALRLVMAAGSNIDTQRRLIGLSTQVSQLNNMVALATAGSVLTLGISVLGFTLIYKKVKALEGRLKKIEEAIAKVDEKIDLSFYANFRAALDLAENAFSMVEADNRRSSALQAINRFLEAEHVYNDLADKSLNRESWISDQYLLTLCFAYLAEVRCHLELGEYDTALRRFQEGQEQIRGKAAKLVDILLTSTPLMYLHPDLGGKIDLSRLTNIYRWSDPNATENTVFEKIRHNLPELGLMSFDGWVKSLPTSVIDKSSVKRGFLGISDEGKKLVFQRLAEVADEIENVIETCQRFSSYEYELKLLKSAKVPFSKWTQLKPSSSLQSEGQIVCIIPPKPLAL